MDMMPFAEWKASLEVRPHYESLPVSEWEKDECLLWLFNYGAYDCGMAYCDVEDLREEVLLTTH